MKSQILVFGATNVDIVGEVEVLPDYGQCTFGEKVELLPGGSGLNAFLGLSKLKVSSRFISKIGEDFFGNFIIDELKRRNIDFSSIIVSSVYPTGVVFCAITESERTFFAFRKDAADIHILQKDIKHIDLSAEFAFIGGVSIVEGKETYKTFLNVVKKLKQGGTKIFFDPNIRKFNNEISFRIVEMIRYTDVLLPEETELKMIMYNNSKINNIKDIFDIGPKEIWLKMGNKGSKYISPNRTIFFPSLKVRAVDTTGAGDAYNACIIRGYLKNEDYKSIGTKANIYAGLSTTRKGGSTRFPDLTTLIESKKEYFQILKEVKVL
ncbi:MAG: carbohydrate kinase family protein [Kosmotogaceae bacterium]